MIATVFWAARCSDERIRDVINLLKAENYEDMVIVEASLDGAKVDNAYIVINSQFPYRTYLWEWEKAGREFNVISLEDSEAINVPFTCCNKILYI